MAAPQKSPRSPSTKSRVVEPLGTPTYPANGLFTILTTTTISAPVSAVLDASLDSSTWPKWNTFVPRVDVISPDSTSARFEVGMRAKFHNKMKETDTKLTASDHTIVSIDKMDRDGMEGWSIVWKTVGIPGGEWVLWAERVQELVEAKLGNGTIVTQYRTWGTFGGPMAYLLQWSGTRDDIAARFEDWANDLKAYVEGQSGGG